jgi:hypothetical protein
MRIALVLSITALLGLQSVAQQISGKVTDSETGLPIAGTEIRLLHTNKGTLTNTSGVFVLNTGTPTGKLLVSHIGYQTQEIDFSLADNPLSISLYRHITELDEIQVMAQTAREGHTPIAFSKIDTKKIALTLGDRPLPEVMNFSPGVYASRDGGGSGDATLTIRGFQQENLAVLLNGIPINGAENGLVYWNNWLGLTEVARSIEFQRGIGSSKVTQNSVGGTVNIVTVGTGTEASGLFSHQLTSYGNTRSSLSYNSGEMNKGWSFSLLGSRTSGPGYVDGTYVDGWAYFMSVAKNLGPGQRLLFTALGGPERHGQRTMKISQAEVDHFGHKYNKEWGHDNGRINNASENFYHKPHLGLTHYLQLNNKTLLVSTLYFSPGWGGGKWNDSYQYGPGVFAFRNASGQIDWDAIYRYNASNQDTAILADGTIATGFSKLVQTNFLASHIWAGVLSILETDIGYGLRLTTGLHYRFFSSSLRQEVASLLGGRFYIDDYSWSLAGIAGRPQIRMPGDNIRLHNGAILNMMNSFAQLEKSFGQLTVFAAGSLSGQTYRRRDVYNYPDKPLSETVLRGGFDVKGGLNYRTGLKGNIYLNSAHFNRLPYYKFVFGNFNNVPVRNIGNEKVNTIEAGYELRGTQVSLSLSAYSTLWKDVSFLTQEYIQLENAMQTRAMVSGLDALHQGIESNLNLNFFDFLKLGFIAGFGNWKWKKDVDARILNDRNVVVDTVKVYANGLFVGGAPQLQMGFQAEARLLKKIDIIWRTMHYDRHYATFDPAKRQNPADRQQAYRLPAYSLTDIHTSMPLTVLGQECTLYLNANNIFDQIYILKGEDGPGHTAEAFRGFWSFGRNVDMGIRLSF